MRVGRDISGAEVGTGAVVSGTIRRERYLMPCIGLRRSITAVVCARTDTGRLWKCNRLPSRYGPGIGLALWQAHPTGDKLDVLPEWAAQKRRGAGPAERDVTCEPAPPVRH